MTTEQKPETGSTKNGEKTPVPAKPNGKPNGKPKINKSDAPEKPLITRCSTSNSHNTTVPKSPSNLPKQEEQVQLTGEVIAVDDPVQVPPAVNGIDLNKKKTKEVKDENEEKESSLLYQIPMSRVSRIVKSEDPNVRITQEAVYIINKASEKFLHVFTTEAYASAFLDHKKHIDYKHLSSVVAKRKRFDFLSDFVPEKLKAEDALTESQPVEN